MRALLACFMLVFVSCALDSEENRTVNVPTPRPFEFDGKPIPPSAIDAFVGNLAQMNPEYASLDIEGFFLGDRDDGKVTVEGNRIVICASKHRADETVLVID